MRKLLSMGYTLVPLKPACFTCVIETQLPLRPLLISDGHVWMLGETTQEYDDKVQSYLEKLIHDYQKP